MPSYEYKVVPAPQKGVKARGVRAAEDRFALALERVMNQMGEDGWEFHRSETLPSEERRGLTQSVTEWRNVLVFRRIRASDAEAFQPRLLESPKPAALPEPQPDPFAAMQAKPAPEDNGGDASDEVTSLSSLLKARAAKARGSDMAAE